MIQLRSRRTLVRVMCACLCLLVLFLAFKAFRHGHAPSNPVNANDPQSLLREADRLALLGNWGKARPLFAKAEDVFTRQGDKRDALYAHISRLRSEVESLSYLDASRYLAEELKDPVVQNDPRLKLRCLTVKGTIDLNTNTAAAQEDWTEVLRLAKVLGDPIWEGRANGELGILDFINGKAGDARGLVVRAILSATLHRDIYAEIMFMTFFGEGLTEYNRPKEALVFLDRALKLANSNPDVELPFQAYITKVGALRTLNRSQEAWALLDQALDEARRTNTLGAQADLLREGGLLAEQQGNARKAEAYYETAAEVAKRANLPRLLGETMFRLTDLYRASGDLAKAESCAARGADAIRQVDARYELPHYLATQAEVDESLGHFRQADELFSEASDLVEGMLVNVSSSKGRSSLIGMMSDIYVGHFRLAVSSLHDMDEALRIVEHARGRVIAEDLRSRKVGSPQSGSSLGPAQAEVVDLQKQLWQHHTSTERERLLDRLEEAEARVDNTEEDHLRFNRLFPARPIDLAVLRHSLHPDEMLLEYVLADPASYCLAITGESAKVFEVPSRKHIDAAIQQYSANVKAKQPSTNTARDLYRGLLYDPLSRQPKIRRLIIVPDGSLNELAFDSLLDGKDEYVLQKYIVTVVPSATVLYLLRTLPRPPVSRPFLGVAYSQSESLVASNESPPRGEIARGARGLFDIEGSALTPLPLAREEVVSAASITGKGSIVLLGKDATEESLKAEPLGDFEILHFAVHGIGNPEEPDLSALVLGNTDGSKEDGLWQAWEIRRLALGADLVTLSACNTGIGKLEGEEGVQSLVRAFLMAGAHSVVASLWQADDRFTSTLMEGFYAHLAKGADKGEALELAKRDILHQFGAQTPPYYWAAFMLVGDGTGHVKFHH